MSISPPTVGVLWNELKVNYSFTAALAYSVWDILLTFDEEVEWIWS
jgi:hypothetical protein